ncbi:hypothetical protein [Sphingomonas sp. PB4P5]|uniref:hypothetical protein n=1 Tax=Parasphingomonas puruogangriensis TaxID=3096155 RepID=UPI002FCBBAC1
MKLSRMTAAVMMASLSTPLFAASEQSVGTLTSASQGTFVARDGKLIAARSGQSLFAGDRVVTRGKANAKISMSGCNYALGSTSILSVGKGACTAKAQSLAVQDNSDDAGANTGSGAAGGVVLAAAIAAVGLGVYVAVDKDDSSPASP